MSVVSIFCLLSVLLTAYARILNVEDGAQNGSTINLPPDSIGKELGLSKPIDYPTDAIDRISRRLQSRSKRHYDEKVYTAFDQRNGCTASRQEIQPFTAVFNQTRHLVIQSEFYTQTIPSVTCKREGSGCLKDFKFSGSKPSCITKFSTVSLSVFHSKESSVTNINVTFPVDCACQVNDDDSK